MEWAVRRPPAREGINAPYARNISWTLLSGEGFTPAPGTGPACMGLGHQRLRERQGRGPGVRVGAQLLDLGSLHVEQAARRWADSTTGAARTPALSHTLHGVWAGLVTHGDPKGCTAASRPRDSVQSPLAGFSSSSLSIPQPGRRWPVPRGQSQQVTLRAQGVGTVAPGPEVCL